MGVTAALGLRDEVLGHDEDHRAAVCEPVWWRGLNDDECMLQLR